MATWKVNVEVLYRGEIWKGKKVRLWSKWPGFFGNSIAHFDEYTDDDGHAIFEIEDDRDRLRDDTPICFTVKLNGTNYDFGTFDLGDGAFTVNVDPDDEPDEVTVEDLTDG